MNFVFEAFGQKLSFDCNDKSEAFTRANKFFRQLLGDGAWFDTSEFGNNVNGYYWAVGNFFD